MDLNAIPQDQRDKFPMGVFENKYPTEAEMTAFIDGLCYADDNDVDCGEVFQRNGMYVVRVQVGDW